MKEIAKVVRELKNITVNGEIKSAAQQLMEPGDFAYSKVGKPDGKTFEAVILRCPKCNNPITIPFRHGGGPLRKVVIIFYRLLNRRGELLTIEPGVICNYCDLKFKVKLAQIELLET